MRPGLVGTVADERVDPIDVTATLIDLAVRGHLRITELQHTQYGLVDWQFSRLENPGDELAPYEALLLDAVVPDGSHSLASQLPQVLAPALGGVQDALYNEVVERAGLSPARTPPAAHGLSAAGWGLASRWQRERRWWPSPRLGWWLWCCWPWRSRCCG